MVITIGVQFANWNCDDIVIIVQICLVFILYSTVLKHVESFVVYTELFSGSLYWVIKSIKFLCISKKIFNFYYRHLNKL